MLGRGWQGPADLEPAARATRVPMAEYTAYFCGQWVPFREVRIDPLDRGFLVGDCVFDVARTFERLESPRGS